MHISQVQELQPNIVNMNMNTHIQMHTHSRARHFALIAQSAKTRQKPRGSWDIKMKWMCHVLLARNTKWRFRMPLCMRYMFSCASTCRVVLGGLRDQLLQSLGITEQISAEENDLRCLRNVLALLCDPEKQLKRAFILSDYVLRASEPLVTVAD